MAYGAASNGESVKVIFPSSGTVIAPRPMMILKTSHVQNEARAFIDYVLSDEGQKLVADAWLIPARDDIAGTRPPLKDLKLLPQDDGSNTKTRAEVLARFNALFGDH